MEKKARKISGAAVAAITCLVVIIAGVVWTVVRQQVNDNSSQEITDVVELPKPKKSDGIRGEQFGVDKNINEETLDKYLGRSDVVYRDMRMLKDPGNYEAIGGDSYLSGFVEGFEVVPYPYLVNVSGLPEEVGESYTGKTLFTQTKDGQYVANYEESMQILEDLFPKNKKIFLMCGGAGYAGMTKDLLINLSWDADNIYNVGGYWYYNGEHDVKVKTERNGETVYDFWKVPYHNIDFASLHEKKADN